jgi:protoporphyrinogen oxidase
MMPKQVGVTFEDEVYAEILRRAGGERKISKYLNPLLRTVFAQPEADIAARLAALEQEVARLRQGQGREG